MIPKETLKEVIKSQREVLRQIGSGTPREEKVRIEDSFALVISGVRRCGKSTLLSQLLEKNKKGYYVNFEDPRLDGFELPDFSRLEEVFKEVYGDNGIYFFDEIQNVEKWEKFVRFLTDKKQKVVITGSNASLLSKELGTKLTGRHIQTELFPFSYKEFLSMTEEKPSVKSFDEYSQKGGFPEYLKKENPLILNELLSDVVIKDIAVRFGIKNTNMLNKLVLYLISNVGKEFSYNSLKKMFGVKSVQSIIDYVSYLEDAYLIFTVPCFSYSYKQQQINRKKVYSIDNGFSNHNSVSFSKDRGKMLENAVFLCLRRKWKDIFYFRDQKECDFIVKEKGRITQAMQACFELSDENRDREIRGLIAALKKFSLKEGIILTHNQEDNFVVEGKKIVVMPAWKYLYEN